MSGHKFCGRSLLLISTWLFLNPWQAYLISEEMVLKPISKRQMVTHTYLYPIRKAIGGHLMTGESNL